MKSNSKGEVNKQRRLSAAEVKSALKWIDSLSEKDIAKYELLAHVQIEEMLSKSFLNI